MKHESKTTDGAAHGAAGNEWGILCVCLCVCFFLLLTSGDRLRALSESDGVSAMSERLREVLQKNETVSALFGLEESAVPVGADDGKTEKPSFSPAEVPTFSFLSDACADAESYIESGNREWRLTHGIPPVDGVPGDGFAYRENPFYLVYAGESAYHFHGGIDLSAPEGTPVLSYLDGTVVTCALTASYGYYVVVDHGDGLATLYAHLSDFAVGEGEHVGAGQTLGYLGHTGRTTGGHLHFEVWRDGDATDPAPYLSALFLSADASDADR